MVFKYIIINQTEMWLTSHCKPFAALLNQLSIKKKNRANNNIKQQGECYQQAGNTGLIKSNYVYFQKHSSDIL